MKLTFYVQGSAPNPYELIFNIHDTLTVSCSCPAGEKKTLCKHILRLIEGDTTGLITEQPDNVDSVCTAFLASDAKNIYDEWKHCEGELDDLKEKTKNIKRKFSKALFK